MLPKRGHYKREIVHAVLDAGVLCHVGYVIEGQPYVTPTCHWRHGDRLYWHGSSASRMLRHLKQGVPACVTVTHLDGFVLARSGFHHSVNYRSVMALGQARLVPDEGKLEALRDFVERSTSLTADTFGITDRGRLRARAFADIVLFEPNIFAARATYEAPTELATGVRTVIVNGVVAVDNGALTGAAAGRGLAHVPTAGSCR